MPDELSRDRSDGFPGPNSLPASRARKWAAGLFSVVLVAAVAAPIVRNWEADPHDSFPLSYYPMFSYRRDPITPITYLVGIDADGNRRNLHYRFAARGGMNQVRRQINRRVSEGKAEVLCMTVAGNLAASNAKWSATIARVEIRTNTYDLREYFTGRRIPVTEQVHHTCMVERHS